MHLRRQARIRVSWLGGLFEWASCLAALSAAACQQGNLLGKTLTTEGQAAVGYSTNLIRHIGIKLMPEQLPIGGLSFRIV